jgi:hypothetical protein
MGRTRADERGWLQGLLEGPWWVSAAGSALGASGSLILKDMPASPGSLLTAMSNAGAVMLGFAAILLYVISFLSLLGISGVDDEQGQLRFRREETGLLNEAERRFLAVLEEAAGPRVRVFARVRVLDVLQPVAPIGTTAWHAAFNRISQKYFDFALCTADTLQVFAVVELHESGRRHVHRRPRDANLEAACASAFLPLIRFRTRESYDVIEIRRELATWAELPAARGRADPPRSCPGCGRPLLRVIAESGELRGWTVWRCTECRTTIPAGAEPENRRPGVSQLRRTRAR